MPIKKIRILHRKKNQMFLINAIGLKNKVQNPRFSCEKRTLPVTKSQRPNSRLKETKQYKCNPRIYQQSCFSQVLGRISGTI